jgi:NTE family protein
MTGLVFEGGGAKGAYQIGVWKYIRENKIRIDGVVGTSVGAVNAAAFAVDDLEFAENMWKELSIEKIAEGEYDKEAFPKEFKLETEEDMDMFYEKFIRNDKGLDITPMINMLKENIKENEIRKKGMDFGLVTYNLSLKKLEELFIEDIPANSLYKYIMASSYLPVFKAVKLNGCYYLDGGFFNNLPLNMLAKKGYKKIISVRLRPERYDYSYFKGIEIIDISPEEPLGGTLDFDKERIKTNIELGYRDAGKILSDAVDSFIS